MADLHLVLDGVSLPWAVLGGRLDEPLAEPSGVAPGRPAPLRVAVRAQDAAEALGCGAVVLVDREQTPLARLADLAAAGTAADGSSLVGGRLEPLRAREAQLFPDRVRRPDQLPPAEGRRVVVVAGRPPLRGELQSLATEPDDELLVLVPVELPTADGVPPVVLMRSVEAALRAEAVPARCLPVPLVWRGGPSDDALAGALGAAYRGHRTVTLGADVRWDELVTALHEGRSAPDAVANDVLLELLQWRPPRGERGLVVLFTGLSGSGKSTLARDLAQHVVAQTRRTVSLLDGDDVRRLLSSGLGFDRAARDLNVRRIGYVASEAARHGGIAICAPIAPYAESRAALRRMVSSVGDLVLVHVSTPLAECERRDLKGLYAKARAGEISEFTGVSDPYDVPTDADVTVDTSAVERSDALRRVLDHLERGGWLTCRPGAGGTNS